MCTSVCRIASLLEKLAGLERDHAAAGDDDVVEKFDPQKLAALNETTGDGKVFLARFGVAARMVMHQQNRGSRADYAGRNTSRGYVAAAVMWCSAAKSFWPLIVPSRDAT